LLLEELASAVRRRQQQQQDQILEQEVIPALDPRLPIHDFVDFATPQLRSATPCGWVELID
jgi:aspartyl-tRNA synthetase